MGSKGIQSLNNFISLHSGSILLFRVKLVDPVEFTCQFVHKVSVLSLLYKHKTPLHILTPERICMCLEEDFLHKALLKGFII